MAKEKRPQIDTVGFNSMSLNLESGDESSLAPRRCKKDSSAFLAAG